MLHVDPVKASQSQASFLKWNTASIGPNTEKKLFKNIGNLMHPSSQSSHCSRFTKTTTAFRKRYPSTTRKRPCYLHSVVTKSGCERRTSGNHWNATAKSGSTAVAQLPIKSDATRHQTTSEMATECALVCRVGLGGQSNSPGWFPSLVGRSDSVVCDEQKFPPPQPADTAVTVATPVSAKMRQPHVKSRLNSCPWEQVIR